jgi:hypothetical protein
VAREPQPSIGGTFLELSGANPVRIAEQLADDQSPARLQDARKLGQCCILVGIWPRTARRYELAMSEDAFNLAGELLAAISAQTQTPGLDFSEAGSIRRLPS